MILALPILPYTNVKILIEIGALSGSRTLLASLCRRVHFPVCHQCIISCWIRANVCALSLRCSATELTRKVEPNVGAAPTPQVYETRILLLIRIRHGANGGCCPHLSQFTKLVPSCSSHVGKTKNNIQIGCGRRYRTRSLSL